MEVIDVNGLRILWTGSEVSKVVTELALREVNESVVL